MAAVPKERVFQSEGDFMKLCVDVAENLVQRYDIDEITVQQAILGIRKQMGASEEDRDREIDYKKIERCIGYLKGFAAIHASVVLHETKNLLYDTELLVPSIEHSIRNSLTSGHCFRIVSVSGGPGVDILAFFSAGYRIFKNHRGLRFWFTVVDLKERWKEVFGEVMREYQQQALPSKAPPDLTTEFHPGWSFIQDDVRRPSMEEVKTADVILLTKTLSNMKASERTFVLENIFASMKKGAIFLLMDTVLQDTDLQRLIKTYKLEILDKRSAETFKANQDLLQYNPLSIQEYQYDICALKKKLKK